ncbi:MAG: Na/Pi symporter [Saprospiraceae bacterium]|nr:Na/Pi symporter [Candidatus Vicinibacter affinis]MBK7303999.1 Na/Pi symporter [Candidatus Vicinibacter affinis]MBK9641008.1 Na/Pi symporter [Candidatus Vicinibacter affinis]HQX44899.1 Na/Pi symporter [Saprospiraceae bacterium]
MNPTVIQIWPFLAGLGLFLFGMSQMEESLRKMAGRSFTKFLKDHTRNPIKAVLSGALITAVLQSSAMVTLLVMSFTSAGILVLKSGIAIILGANLGTTITGWLVSLLGFKYRLDVIILPLIAIGGLGTLFLTKQWLNQTCRFLMGFGLIFLGLEYMKGAFAEFAQQMDLTFLNGKPYVLFFAVGFLLAAGLQSSSASMVIFLSALSVGIIQVDQCLFMVIGADLGTTISAFLGTLKGNSIRKKTGWAQIYINVFSAIVAWLMMSVYVFIIREILNIRDDMVAVAAFHSMVNFFGIILMLPFLGIFTKFIDRSISSREVSKNKFLKGVSPLESGSALMALRKEAKYFLGESIRLNRIMMRIDESPDDEIEQYGYMKEYENEITNFYIQMQQGNLSAEDAHAVSHISAAVRNAALGVKDIKDISHNLFNLRNSSHTDQYSYFLKLQTSQQEYYDLLKKLMGENQKDSLKLVQQVRRANLKIHMEVNKTLMEIFASNVDALDFDFSSLMNLTREINNSNEYISQAFENLKNLEMGGNKY